MEAATKAKRVTIWKVFMVELRNEVALCKGDKQTNSMVIMTVGMPHTPRKMVSRLRRCCPAA
jgi:hypothetical protein